MQSTTTSVNVSRRAVLFSGSALLLIVLALSLLIVTHTPHTVRPGSSTASSVVSSDAGASIRQPGRLGYQSEHSVCAAQLADLSQMANADGADGPIRLPGRVYYRQIFQSAYC
ncbi:MAG: hypothetical protein ACRDHE_02320 [Ktedonobacterales bacterium]